MLRRAAASVVLWAAAVGVAAAYLRGRLPPDLRALPLTHADSVGLPVVAFALALAGVLAAANVLAAVVRRAAPAPLHDPALGALAFDAGRWRATPPDAAVPVWLEAGRSGPDGRLRAAAAEAARALPATRGPALAYAAAAMDGPDTALTLAALVVGRVDGAWVRREVLPHHPDAAAALLAGEPAATLQFTIAGDRNVVDVVCVGGRPVGWEYH